MRKEQRSDGTTSGCDGDRRGGRGGTREGAVAELVTRAGDQWRLRLGTTESVPVTAEYLLELMLQLRELRSRGIL